MNDGGTLYRWREDQRKYAPASVMHALVREESGIARDWWEPVCSLAEYLGVELREPALDPAEVRRVVEKIATGLVGDLKVRPRDRGDDQVETLLRAAQMWLRAQEADQRLRYLVACLNGTPALGPDVHLSRQRIEWMNEIKDILGLVRNR